jgi:periplasmic copper chaperone A
MRGSDRSVQRAHSLDPLTLSQQDISRYTGDISNDIRIGRADEGRPRCAERAAVKLRMQVALRRATTPVHVLPFSRRIASFALLVLFALCVAPALANDYALSSLKIEHPYARATPPGARTGGAYLIVQNEGKLPDRLVRVSSPVAKSAAIHSMTMDGNMMRMRVVRSLDIPPGAKVTLSPGGYHVMLVDIAHPLVPGEQVPLTLTFEKAGTIDVRADVEAPPTGVQQHAH